MRQKEVIGQSMRTTKSARPGSVVYVPMDKSEFRSIIFSEKKKNKIKKIVILIILMIFVIGCCIYLIITHITSFMGRPSMGLTVQIRQHMRLSRRLLGKRITILFR